MRGVEKLYLDADSVRSRLAKLRARGEVSGACYDKALPAVLVLVDALRDEMNDTEAFLDELTAKSKA